MNFIVRALKSDRQWRSSAVRRLYGERPRLEFEKSAPCYAGPINGVTAQRLHQSYDTWLKGHNIASKAHHDMNVIEQWTVRTYLWHSGANLHRMSRRLSSLSLSEVQKTTIELRKSKFNCEMASSRPSRIRVWRKMSAMIRIFVYIAVYMILLSVRYQYVLTSPETFTVTTNVYLCPSPRAAQLRSTRIVILFNLSHERGKRRGRLQAAVHAVVFLRWCLAFFNLHQ